ncbi:MAG: hypothetical protein NTV98_02915 [Candidatus Roizmanbacteria bacterium]|nr:hypothetical protein [Candidatus Roizmanbacteria bacterium]
MFHNCKKIIIVSVILFLLLILVIFFIKTQLNTSLTKAENEISTLSKTIHNLRSTKPGELIYRDRDNNYMVRVPYGWKIERTEHWDAMQLVDSDEYSGISMRYYSYPEAQSMDNIDNYYYRQKGESVYQTAQRIANEHYSSFITSPSTIYKDVVKAEVKEFIFAGRSAALLECDHTTIKGAGEGCTKEGSTYRREFYIDDNKGGYLRLSIHGDRAKNLYKVDLAQWIDRVSFLP